MAQPTRQESASTVDSTTRRHAVLLLCGCLVGALLPAAVLFDPRTVWLFVVVPPLLGYGVLEVHRRYGRLLGRAGRVGSGLLGLCLVAWLFGTLLLATRPLGDLGVIAGVALVGLGVAAGGPGSALLAFDLWRRRIISRPLALALGGALLLPILPFGIVVSPLALQVPISVSIGVPILSLELYWLAWGYFGVQLYRAAGQATPERLRL